MTLPPLQRTVRIPLSSFSSFFEKFERSVVREMFDKGIKPAGRVARRYLEQETLRREIFFKKKYARGWRVERGAQTGLSVRVINKEPYGIVIEKGRRRNRRPPPSHVLIPWVIEKLGVSRKEAPRVAFLVARAIGRRGISARPVVGDPRVQAEIQRIVTESMFATLRAGLNKGLTR